MYSNQPQLLFQQVLHRAQTDAQRDALHAVLENNDQKLYTALWTTSHGQPMDVLDDQFATPLLLFAALVGGKWVWRILADFGFNAESPVYVGSGQFDDPQEQQWIEEWKDWTLAGWLCCNAEVGRIEELVGTHWLAPWHDVAKQDDVFPAAVGALAFGDTAVADHMMSLLQPEDLNKRKTAFYPTYAFVARHCARFNNATPEMDQEACALAAQELNRRLDMMAELIIRAQYPTTTDNDLWAHVLAKQPAHINTKEGFDALYAHLQKRHAPHSWSEEILPQLLRQHRFEEWAALTTIVPPTHVLACRDALVGCLAEAVLDPIGFGHCTRVQAAWNAWGDVARHHSSSGWENIPDEYRTGLGLFRALKHSRTKREQVVLAIATSNSQGQQKTATPTRKM